MKLEFPREIFEQYSNINLYENSDRKKGQKKEHDEDNNRVLQFCKPV